MTVVVSSTDPRKNTILQMGVHTSMTWVAKGFKPDLLPTSYDSVSYMLVYSVLNCLLTPYQEHKQGLTDGNFPISKLKTIHIGGLKNNSNKC